MTTFAVDAVQGTVGVALQNRAPTDGAGNPIGSIGDWVKEAVSTQNATIRSGGDKASLPGAGKAVYTFRGEQGGTPNYEVVFYVQNAGAATATAIARHDPSVGTYYEAGYVLVSGSGKWQIAKVVAGVGRSVLAEATVGSDWAFAEWMKLIFVCTDDEKTLRLESNSGGKADKIAVTDPANDNTITAEGYAGFCFEGDADKMRMVSFQAETLGAAPASASTAEAAQAAASWSAQVQALASWLESVQALDALMAGEQAAGVVVRDDFADTDATALESHAETWAGGAGIGGGWSCINPEDGGAVIQGNEARLTAGTALTRLEYTDDAALASADYRVEATLTLRTAAQYDVGKGTGLLARSDGAEFGAYSAFLTVGADDNVYAGLHNLDFIETQLIEPAVVGTAYQLVLECEGTTLRAYVDGVLAKTSVSTNRTAPGKAGLLFTGPNTWSIDNFKVTYLGTPPGAGLISEAAAAAAAWAAQVLAAVGWNEPVQAGAAWGAGALAPAAWSEAVQASGTLGAVAQVAATLSESVTAGDATGQAAAALAALQAQASGDAVLDALGQAAAALVAGAAAGEAWTAQAQALAALIEDAAAADAIAAAATDALQAAIAQGSTAGAAFASAVTALGTLSAGAGASDAFAAHATEVLQAELGAGAAAGAALAASVSALGVLGGAAQAGDAWGGAAAALLAVLAERVSAGALITARATAAAALGAAAEAGATFVAQARSGGYLIAGAITLTAALSGSLGISPALGGSLEIKPN